MCKLTYTYFQLTRSLTDYEQIEEEAQKKKDYLLNRAFELRQDQEDEIKQCNSIIMNTKCHAIRSAQIAEKERLQCV